MDIEKCKLLAEYAAYYRIDDLLAGKDFRLLCGLIGLFLCNYIVGILVLYCCDFEYKISNQSSPPPPPLPCLHLAGGKFCLLYKRHDYIYFILFQPFLLQNVNKALGVYMIHNTCLYIFCHMAS